MHHTQKLTKNQEQDYDATTEEYNKSHESEGQSVMVEEYDDDSLVAFLFEKKELRRSTFRDQLRNISYDIESLNDDLYWLKDMLEEFNEKDD